MSEIPCDICANEGDHPSIICCDACYADARAKYAPFAKLAEAAEECIRALKTYRDGSPRIMEAIVIYEKARADAGFA